MADTLTSYEPSWRDVVATALGGLLPRRTVSGLMGSTGLGTTGMGLVDFTPAGIAFGANEAQRAAEEGDIIGAGLGGLSMAGGAGMVPAAKSFYQGFKVSKPALEEVAETFTKKTVDMEKLQQELDEAVKILNEGKSSTEALTGKLEFNQPVALSSDEWAKIIAHKPIEANPKKITGDVSIDTLIALGKPKYEIDDVLNKWYNADAIDEDEFIAIASKIDEHFEAIKPKKGFTDEELENEFGDPIPLDEPYGLAGVPISSAKGIQVPFVTGIPEVDALIPEEAYLGTGTLPPVLDKIDELYKAGYFNKDIAQYPKAMEAVSKHWKPFSESLKTANLGPKITLPKSPPKEELSDEIPGEVPYYAPGMSEYYDPKPNVPVRSKEIIEALGFKPDVYYRGDRGKYSSFRDPRGKDYEKAVFFSPNAEIAKAYGKYLYPVHLKMQNPYDVDWLSWKLQQPDTLRGDESRGYSTMAMDAVIETAKRLGHDSVVVRGIEDVGSSLPQDQIMVFSDNQIRSIWAKFDPAKAHLSDLLAGLAGGAVVAPALFEPTPLEEQALPLQTPPVY